MSILNVEHLSHGFGDRAIFHDVSFRLLKGEHIGLIGANGEGKSTFMNIITGRLQPDEGKVEWSKNVRAGYLDQHTALEKGMTIRQVLTSAFDFLLDMEQELNGIYEKMGEADEDTMQQLMEDAGTLQELLTAHDFYMIDSKVEEVGRALGLSEIGLDKDVSELSGGQRTKVLLGKLLLEKPDILLLDEPTNYLDVSHIEWLKRYLNDYENAFILISHDIPFLNSVVNLIYHMDNQQLTRYVGDYDKFQEVYAMKKAQLEAAYNKQQKEIADLKDFVARNKARVATRNMAMARQKKLDKMDIIELDRAPVLGHDFLILVLLMHAAGKETIAVLLHAADHIRLFNIALLKGQKHLVSHLRQEIMSPFLSSGRHGHPRPFQFICILVAYRHAYAHASRHIFIIIFRHHAYRHAEHSVISGLRL